MVANPRMAGLPLTPDRPAGTATRAAVTNLVVRRVDLELGHLRTA